MSKHQMYLFSPRTSLALASMSALIIVVIDLISPPGVMVSIFFVVPVLIVAWHNGFLWGLAFSIGLSWTRFTIGHLFESLWSIEYHLINAFDRTITLALVSFVVSRLSASVKHIRTLEGMLPICSHCKKIRDAAQEWQPLEKYISEHSQATFTHGLCPDCTKIYFPNVKAPG